jgi:hypothetical protein
MFVLDAERLKKRLLRKRQFDRRHLRGYRHRRIVSVNYHPIGTVDDGLY